MLSSLRGLRVGYFGRYDPSYSRNVILTKCFERAGAEVVPVRDDRSLAWRTPSLLRRGFNARLDLLVVGFRAHGDMFAASVIARKKNVPLMFDPLVSRYEEKVVDRKLVRDGTPLARWYAASDRAGCRRADRILLETDHQIDYFSKTFGVERARFRRVWLGADDEIMRPLEAAASRDPFTVFFYGRFSPLHGVEHIVQAAACLEQDGNPVRFVMVGAGQTYQAARAQAVRLGVSTIDFHDPVPYPSLAAMMAEADVCLGSFGTTARAQRVIPNKVFDAFAVGKAVITADTPGAREAIVHGEHAWLCAPGDGRALAEAIAALKRSPDVRAALAANGHRLFTERFSIAALTRDLSDIVGDLLRDHGAHSLSR